MITQETTKEGGLTKLDFRLVKGKVTKNTATKPLILRSSRKQDLLKTAELLIKGKIVAFPFNGVFGLFGDIDNPRSTEMIMAAKHRPKQKKLIQVCSPEHIQHYADLSKLSYERDKVIELWKNVHALGFIFPALMNLPDRLVLKNENDLNTVAIFWSEYKPLRIMMDYFHKLGGKGLVGTSANISGKKTHTNFDELVQDFKHSVHGLVHADFSDLPDVRKQSTTIIDLCSDKPRLHREGNVLRHELSDIFKRHGFPDLNIQEENLLHVKQS